MDWCEILFRVVFSDIVHTLCVAYEIVHNYYLYAFVPLDNRTRELI